MLRRLYATIPELRQRPLESVIASYDEGADVLYLRRGRPRPATDTDARLDAGLLLRYRGDELVGITGLDAAGRLAAAPSG